MQLVQLLSGTESTITHSSLVDSLCHHLQRNAPGVRPLLFRHSRSRFCFFFFFLLPPISPSLSSCRRACSWHNGKFWLIDWFLGRTSNSLAAHRHPGCQELRFLLLTFDIFILISTDSLITRLNFSSSRITVQFHQFPSFFSSSLWLC